MIIIHPLIDPVIVSFGFLEIRWYSLAYVLGFLIGIYLIKKINSKFHEKDEKHKFSFTFLIFQKVN